MVGTVRRAVGRSRRRGTRPARCHHKEKLAALKAGTSVSLKQSLVFMSLANSAKIKNQKIDLTPAGNLRPYQRNGQADHDGAGTPGNHVLPGRVFVILH